MSSLFDEIPESDQASDGEALRDAALARLRTHRPALIRELQIATLRFALSNGNVCADDVRELVSIPTGISPKVVGAAFRELAEMILLRNVGSRKSTRPAAYARPIAVWELADIPAATAWLATHSAQEHNDL